MIYYIENVNVDAPKYNLNTKASNNLVLYKNDVCIVDDKYIESKEHLEIGILM